jgi:putative ABC transport system substrate-binding protein
LDLLKELLPRARRVALIVNGLSASPRFVSAAAPDAAARHALQIDSFEIPEIDELSNAIEGARFRGADAFLVIPDPIFTIQQTEYLRSWLAFLSRRCMGNAKRLKQVV